jgi:hypothetical protein
MASYSPQEASNESDKAMSWGSNFRYSVNGSEFFSAIANAPRTHPMLATTFLDSPSGAEITYKEVTRVAHSPYSQLVFLLTACLIF